MVFVLKRFLVGTALAGLAMAPVLAQEAPAERGSLNFDAPTARADAIESFQVRVADSEYMAGRVRVLDSVSGVVRPVRKTGLLIVENGQVVGRAETGEGGVAQIPQLPIGFYSVVAVGPDGIGAFGLEVLPPAEGVTVSTYRFDTLIVPSADIGVGQQVLFGAAPRGAAAPGPGALGPAPIGPGLTGPPSELPVSALQPIRGDEAYSTVDEAAPLKGDSVVVGNDGSGTGQLMVFDPKSGEPTGLMDARVVFLRNGKVFNTFSTDSEGRFSVSSLDAGHYSMVGVGTNGFVAMGIHVEKTDIAPITASGQESDEQVSLLQPPPPPPVDFGVAGAGIDAMGFAPGFGPFDPLAEDPFMAPFPEPVPGGFAGFGGGGGGFGAGGGGGLFGGGGLLGALLGAGAGIGIGAAVADDDDGGFTPPASPSVP